MITVPIAIDPEFPSTGFFFFNGRKFTVNFETETVHIENEIK